MEKFLVWILLQLLVEVTSSKLSLDIQVHVQQFENLYNVEMKDGMYCCCDAPTCVANISDMISHNCTAQCETYFKIYTTDCSSFELCSLTTNIISDSPSVINWPIIDLSLLMSTSKTQNGLKIEAWDDDERSDADQIDSFTVPMPATVLNNTQSSSITVQGVNETGILTVIYQNVSKGNNSCNSADQSSSNTCLNSEEDSSYTCIYSTSTCSSCPVSTKWMVSPTEQVTVTCLQTSATVTMSTEISMTILLWKVMSILLIVVTISLAITSIALGIFAYRLRKPVNSEPNSKFTTHNGS